VQKQPTGEDPADVSRALGKGQQVDLVASLFLESSSDIPILVLRMEGSPGGVVELPPASQRY
jgi:hypothetical protein